MQEDGLNAVPSKNTKDVGCPALTEGLWKQIHQPDILQKKNACFLFPLKHQISFLEKLCERIIVFSVLLKCWLVFVYF